MKRNRDPLALHGELLRELGNVVMQTANAHGPWEEVYCDIRQKDGFRLERTVVRSRTSRELVHLPTGAGEIQEKLCQLSATLPSNRWYGIFMRIDKSGKVEVSYNYDSKCIETLLPDEEARRPF